MVDISRSTSGVLLPQVVSEEILAKVQEESIIQRVARQVPMAGTGVSFRTITGDSVASWVGETDSKPVSNGTVGSKTVTPYKLAVIQAYSNEFRRDLPSLYAELTRRLPNALAKKFDLTAMHGNVPGSNFDTLADVQTVNLAGGVYDGMVDTITLLGNASHDFNGIVLSPAGEALALSEKDQMGRPLFINSPATDGAIGSILGRGVFRSKHAAGAGDVVGFGGDWSQAMWGTVEGVSIKVSDQATLDLGEGETINLFQQNMFAILAEVEVAFGIAHEDAFVKFIND